MRYKVLLTILAVFVLVLVGCRLPEFVPRYTYYGENYIITPEELVSEESLRRLLHEQIKKMEEERLAEQKRVKLENFLDEIITNFAIECVEWQSITSKKLVDENINDECMKLKRMSFMTDFCHVIGKECLNNIPSPQTLEDVAKCNRLYENCILDLLYLTNKTLALEYGCLEPTHFINVTEQKCVKELLVRRPK